MFKKIVILVSILFLSCNFAIAQQKLPTFSSKQNFKRAVDPKSLDIFGVTIMMPFTKADSIITSLIGYKLIESKDFLATRDNQVIKVYENPTTKEKIKLYGSKYCKSNNVLVRGVVHNYEELSLKDRQALFIGYVRKYGNPSYVSGSSSGGWILYWFLHKSSKEWRESNIRTKVELSETYNIIDTGLPYFGDFCLE